MNRFCLTHHRYVAYPAGCVMCENERRKTMDRQYKFFTKTLGKERRELTEEQVVKLLPKRLGDPDMQIIWLKCGQKIVVEGTLLIAEAVA